jgi:hypothetical protein
MVIKKIPTFKSPEGQFRSKIVDIVEKGGGERFILQLHGIKDPIHIYMAAVTYMPWDTGKLIETLNALTDSKLESVINEDGELIEAGLQELIGKVCDVEIEHVPTRVHDHPFCDVVRIAKAGSLVNDPEQPRA